MPVVSLKKKEPEAIQFTGDNFDELKKFMPELEQLKHRTEKEVAEVSPNYKYHGYNVGFKKKFPGILDPIQGEAFPGMWIVNFWGERGWEILDEDTFHKEFQV